MKISSENPTLPDVHPRGWMRGTNYPDLPFHESLQAFLGQRQSLLSILLDLSFEDWSRAATIGGRRHTVFSQVRRMAKHEQEHVKQIGILL